ncbi:hypothetical protein BDW22DRAFT_1039301 [Trametopsis cervina]|nr:hypothetical protein BDW22DRAFT_1039301 [Trametopsis cervina]
MSSTSHASIRALGWSSCRHLDPLGPRIRGAARISILACSIRRLCRLLGHTCGGALLGRRARKEMGQPSVPPRVLKCAWLCLSARVISPCNRSSHLRQLWGPSWTTRSKKSAELQAYSACRTSTNFDLQARPDNRHLIVDGGIKMGSFPSPLFTSRIPKEYITSIGGTHCKR